MKQLLTFNYIFSSKNELTRWKATTIQRSKTRRTRWKNRNRSLKVSRSFLERENFCVNDVTLILNTSNRFVHNVDYSMHSYRGRRRLIVLTSGLRAWPMKCLQASVMRMKKYQKIRKTSENNPKRFEFTGWGKSPRNYF